LFLLAKKSRRKTVATTIRNKAVCFIKSPKLKGSWSAYNLDGKKTTSIIKHTMIRCIGLALLKKLDII